MGEQQCRHVVMENDVDLLPRDVCEHREYSDVAVTGDAILSSTSYPASAAIPGRRRQIRRSNRKRSARLGAGLESAWLEGEVNDDDDDDWNLPHTSESQYRAAAELVRHGEHPAHSLGADADDLAMALGEFGADTRVRDDV